MEPAAGRILDANLNRAREALRVVEDYARFARNDEALQAALKQLRHDFAAATAQAAAAALSYRDTPADVGTGVSTASEMQRGGLGDVVIAAGKRLGEALRVIEELLKIDQPSAAGAVEALRYRFYNLEQQIARGLHRPDLSRVRLHVLITESLCRLPWLEVARLAIEGGAQVLQLRQKELIDAELLNRAQRLANLCHERGALCIINDRPDVALLSGADGVHLGQGDLPAAQVRQRVGRGLIIGVSTHGLDQARQAQFDGADYIGVGPMFPSTTKPQEVLAGPGYARQVATSLPIPAVAIGGITTANVDQVIATGVSAVAVSSAVISTQDPRSAASALRARWKD